MFLLTKVGKFKKVTKQIHWWKCDFPPFASSQEELLLSNLMLIHVCCHLRGVLPRKPPGFSDFETQYVNLFNFNFLPSLYCLRDEGKLNPISTTMVQQEEKKETEHSVLSGGMKRRRRGSRRYLGPRCPESCPQAGCWFNWCVPLNQRRIIAIWLVAFCNPACELFRWRNIARRRLQTS